MSKYQNDYLSEVIVRLDFLQPNAISKLEKLPDEVENLCKKTFPTSNEIKAEFQTMQLIPTQGLIPQAPIIKRVWEFANAENTSIAISDESFLIKMSKYTGFETLKSQFLEIFDALIEAFNDLRFIRLGVRYINQIPIDCPDEKSLYATLHTLFADELISALEFSADDSKPIRQLNYTETKNEDGVIKFQWGIFNENYPTPIKNQNFLIDTDVYLAGIIEKEQVNDLLIKFHEKIKIWFEKAIKDTLRGKMVVKESE